MIGPRCPKCRHPVPFRRTQWGLGKPFDCAGCDARLKFSKVSWVPLAAILSYLALKPHNADLVGHAKVLVPLLIAMTLYSLAMKPRLVGET